MEDVVCKIIKALMADFKGISLHVCEVERTREVCCTEITFYIVGICVIANTHFSVKIILLYILIKLAYL
jgi:hypothetical protein